MRIPVFCTIFSVLVSANPTPKVEAEEEEEHPIAKSINSAHNNSYDSQFFTLIQFGQGAGDGKAYLAIIEKHKNLKDFNDVLSDLKKVDPRFHDKLKPLYEKNREAYLTLSRDARAYMKQYFASLWSTAVAMLQDEKHRVRGILKREQGDALKRKLDALSAEEKSAVEAKFPMLTRFIDSRAYEKEDK